MSIFLVLPLVLLSFIAFVLGVIYLITRCRRIMLCICFGFVILGFLLYTAGYLSSGTGIIETLLASLRGLFSAARMLSMNDDYGVLTDIQGTQWLTENIWAKILLWLCYISALIILQTALIALFGRKLIDRFRLRFGLHREVYIIKGSGKNAVLLGENIATGDAVRKRPDNNRLIVFLIDEDDDEKKTCEITSRFGGIVQALDRNNDLLSRVRKIGLKKEKKHKKSFNIILMPDDVSLSDDTRRIAEYAKENDIPHDKLDIFVLTSSQWDREEIEAITQEKGDDNKRKYPYTIHIVNEADIITRQMVERHPPFKCVDFSEKAEAARNFTVMILGFGTVGQHAFLRLMMNGQFSGSRMRAIVVDKDMDNVRDCFLHRYPGLELCCNIEFKNFDVRCEEFFKLLNETDNVDYVVIALSNDEINKQTALDIRLNYERKNIKTFPFIAVLEKNRSPRNAEKDNRIFIFGCCEEVYKESVIIRAEADRMAKAVNDVYKEMYGGQPWHELDWFLQESNRAAADFIPAMLSLAKREERDTIEENILTGDSSLAEILAQTEHLRWNAFHAAMGYLPIGLEEMRRRFEKYDGEKNSRENFDYCRRDSKARLHACLVPWDELDKVNEVYRELARRAGSLKEQKRDFKENDRDIIRNIPLFLKKAVETIK